MRTLFALLLITNLLACPARCISCDVADSAARVDRSLQSESDPVACCSSCYGHREVPPSDDSSPCGDDDCECQNCICEGALTENGPEIPSLDFCDVVWSSVDTAVATSPCSRTLLRLVDRQPTNDRFLSGRDARIGLQSLLI